MFKDLFEKPFKVISIVGCVYIVILIALNIFTGFSYKQSIYPFSAPITFGAYTLVLLLFSLTLFLKRNTRNLYYLALEILVFASLYDGIIYTALFVSSILLVLLLTEHRKITRKNIAVYAVIAIVKLAMVVPYGITEFLNYVGLSLFALCTIGCINLLFRHAYTKKDPSSLNLDDYKLTERQKTCIKEIVVNNTTIKALAIDFDVSESAIKKDLAHIYKVLGITGKADLKALFIDYKFEF